MPLENKPSPVKPRTPACLSPQQHRELYEPENALQCHINQTSVTQARASVTVLQAGGITKCYRQKVLQSVKSRRYYKVLCIMLCSEEAHKCNLVQTKQKWTHKSGFTKVDSREVIEGKSGFTKWIHDIY